MLINNEINYNNFNTKENQHFFNKNIFNIFILIRVELECKDVVLLKLFLQVKLYMVKQLNKSIVKSLFKESKLILYVLIFEDKYIFLVF